MSIEFELIDESDPNPLGKIFGSQIYTDGSKINGRVGAAITWWTNNTESEHQTLSLHPSCSIYQRKRTPCIEQLQWLKPVERVVNILRKYRNANAEGKEIRFYWLRAHVGTKGNERADELAKSLPKRLMPTMITRKFPILGKSKIREETILKWQTRYDSSQTGAITKTFFPDAKKAYATIRKLKPTPVQTQIFTGHTGNSGVPAQIQTLTEPELRVRRR
ncbi:hypothetical protein EVAR_84176_1 [Eumeta japonica]|uniref:Uncharacterized protein n=1 Tax=Eumeta variegata TaxID=151549 RepID=A0A4C1ZYY3_EUMVA|nr:hypothetical protein EVAR_84176_1 [Eumeta japonica]